MCEKLQTHNEHLMTLEFTRTTHSFSPCCGERSTRFVWVGMAFQLEAKNGVVKRTEEDKKVIQTGGNRVGKQGWVFGFLIKI